MDYQPDCEVILMDKIKEFAKKLLTFISNHRELVIGLAVIALFLVVSVFLYTSHKKVAEETPVIHTVYSPQNAELAPYAVLDAAKANSKTISTRDASDIARLATRYASTEKAYAHSITTDEAVADNQAKEIAKDRKADMIIKQTSEDTKASNDKIQVQDNNYFLIQQERKHSISVGPSIDVDSHKVDAAISYRNRNVTYTVATDGHCVDNVTVQYQIARW